MNHWRKDIASWKVGDNLYLSVPFTWQMSTAQEIAQQHKGNVITGGPGTGQPSECVGFEPILFHNPCATFTTRGCPNTCRFCGVPKIEGDFREIKNYRPAPMVCDNNILASRKKHFEKVIDSLKPFPFVDFNQGLDCRLFSEWHASELKKLHHVKVRFAFDHDSMANRVFRAIELARYFGLTDIGVYCLIGYDDTPDTSMARLELVRSWGVWPNAMRYQPLDALKKNSYVAAGWTEAELRKMMQYYNRLRWYEHIPYGDFERYPYNDNDTQQMSLI